MYIYICVSRSDLWKRNVRILEDSSDRGFIKYKLTEIFIQSMYK